jgi:signal transduction histidine kinase
MDLIARLRAFARAHPSVVDVVLAAGFFLTPAASSVTRYHLHPAAWPEISVLGYGLVAFAPLLVRRRYPIPVLVISTLATVGYIADGHPRGPMLFAPMLAAYTVSVSCERSVSLGWGLPAVLAVGTVSMVTAPQPWNNDVNGVAFAWVGLAVAVGEAVRTRRAFVAAIEERARRAEYTREEEARRRVVEERLRIARELHDIVGHHIALINVQAGVASHVLTTQPEVAQQALAHVREAGRSALAELAATVSVLRRADDPDPGGAQSGAPDEPAPGLARLDELLASFEQLGLTIGREVTGELHHLSSAVDLAAYRIVQESLTNVRKHAGAAAAAVRLDFLPDLLRIEVDNEPADESVDATGAGRGTEVAGGTGYGIIGMRERTAALGGDFRAEPRIGGGFRVQAELPLGERPVRAGRRIPAPGTAWRGDKSDKADKADKPAGAGSPGTARAAIMGRAADAAASGIAKGRLRG